MPTFILTVAVEKCDLTEHLNILILRAILRQTRSIWWRHFRFRSRPEHYRELLPGQFWSCQLNKNIAAEAGNDASSIFTYESSSEAFASGFGWWAFWRCHFLRAIITLRHCNSSAPCFIAPRRSLFRQDALSRFTLMWWLAYAVVVVVVRHKLSLIYRERFDVESPNFTCTFTKGGL